MRPLRFLAALSLFAALLASLFVSGCQRPEEGKVENVISFDRIVDSLKPFDTVVIVLKNLAGDTVDVVFRGKVVDAQDLQRLKAPHWDGGQIVVSITGTLGGKVAYQVDTRFDPATNTRDNVVVFVSPAASLASTVQILTLLVGDSLAHPPVSVAPPTLFDKTLDWEANPSGLLFIGTGHLKAVQAGTGVLTARLRTNPSAYVSISFTIATSGVVPESLSIEPESLEVVAAGPPGMFTAKVFPTAASPAVIWASADTSVATVDSAGRVRGKRQGETSVTAVSKSRPSVTASARVIVSGPIPVETVAFASDSLELFVGALAESLLVTVRPTGANPAVTFTVLDTSKAWVQDGRITGKAIGSTKVIAASVSNPNAKDTLTVKVGGPTPVVKIAFAFDRQDILVGVAESLLVTVSPPGSNPAVAFSLSDSTKATVRNGKITGSAAGTLSVFAASVANPAAKDTLIVTIKVPVPNDTVPPGRPTVRVSPAGPTRERRPTWSWTSGGGGAGAYQISLDKTVFDSTATSLSDTTFKPGADLGLGVRILYVRERDAAGNWSQAGQAQVEIDTAGPSAPRIVGTTPTSALPRWTWSTGGGGGAGFFRSRLGDANFPAGAPESRDTVYPLLSAVTGTTYTLFVQERDAAGNWSPAASHAIKYDLTKPTVAILLPQASGTFITAADTVRVSGTSTGPNGIATLAYTLNAGAAVPMTPGVNGSWATPAITIPNATTSVIKVVATDNLGNTGEAQISVLRDSDPPAPPTSLSNPASPTNVTSASWTWGPGSDGAAGSGLSGWYRWRLGAGTWNEITIASASGITLAVGSNVFSVQEQDRAGNWSAAASDTVVLDNRAPDAVTFVGIDSSYTISRTPTWTWAPSTTNGGIAEYVLKLDAGAEFTWTATTYTPTTPLADNAVHTLTVRQKDQVEGVVGAAKSFSYRVKENPANAPIVTSAVTTLPNNGVTNNPKFVWSSGGGGNGRYRARLNTEPTLRLNGVTTREWSVPAPPTMGDGTYTLHVEEEDVLARWSPVGSFTIQLDRTGPAYTEVRIKGNTWDLRDGYITNKDTLIISYRADGTLKEFKCGLRDNNSTTCSATNTDALGNPSTLTRTIWRRSNVVFFKPVGTGANDGSSWENARNDLTAYLDLPDALGKDLWLASGDYSSQDLTIFFKWVRMYGGFNAAAFPVDANNRTINNTLLGLVSGFNGIGAAASTFDGLRFSKGMGLIGDYVFKDCQSLGHISISEHSNVTATNMELTGVGGYEALSVGVTSTLIWDGGRITGNVPTDNDSYAIEIDETSTVTFKGSLTISGNENWLALQISNYGSLTIESSVSFDCGDIMNQGTGSCRGTPLP